MTLAQFLYFDTLVLFAFVIFAARRISDDAFILACIVPVFLSAIIGIILWIYAWSEFGAVLSVGALLVAWLIVRVAGRLVPAPLLFVMIYLALSGGLLCARFAMQATNPG